MEKYYVKIRNDVFAVPIFVKYIVVERCRPTYKPGNGGGIKPNDY